MRDGSTEHGHDRVADELLHRPAEGFDRSADAREVRRLDGADVLRVELLRAGGEADEVDEEDGDDLPLLGERAGRGRQRRAAGVTEARACRVLVSAAGTDLHS